MINNARMQLKSFAWLLRTQLLLLSIEHTPYILNAFRACVRAFVH